MASFRAAVVQMQAGLDKRANLARAIEQVERAAAAGAALVVLPEMFLWWGPLELAAAQAETIPGPASSALAALAGRLRITLCAGSLPEVHPASPKPFNTCLVFGPDGKELARYRKLHLFEIDLPGEFSGCEAQWISPGQEVVVADTPLGRLGLAICYDLRFPELFRRLVAAGSEVLLVPSAFSVPTGRDHWEILLRARAIESLAYVIAADQCGGEQVPQTATYGHSLIVDPWGLPLAAGGDEQTILYADIDLDRVRQVRARLPALRNRRLTHGGGGGIAN